MCLCLCLYVYYIDLSARVYANAVIAARAGGVRTGTTNTLNPGVSGSVSSPSNSTHSTARESDHHASTSSSNTTPHGSTRRVTSRTPNDINTLTSTNNHGNGATTPESGSLKRNSVSLSRLGSNEHM